MTVVRSRRSRNGASLLELLLVVTLMGIFAAVASAKLVPAGAAAISAQADARRLGLDLLQVQRRSITTGDNHFVHFVSSGGSINGYTICQRVGAGSVILESRQFAPQLSVSASHTELEFTFDGSALAAYAVTLTAGTSSWQAQVVPVTGAIRITPL